MTKNEIIKAVATKTGRPASTVKEIFTAIEEEMLLALVMGDGSVALQNIGTIKVIDRQERKGRNPQTGKEITIPRRKGLQFKGSSVIVRTLNND